MGGTVGFQQCDAFAVVTKRHSQNQKDAALVRRSTTMLSLLRSEQQQLLQQSYRRFSLVGQKLFAANDDDDDEDYDSDDDDDDDDEENGPLSNGIDSVSWLPSVVGKTGENIKGAKEVSPSPNRLVFAKIISFWKKGREDTVMCSCSVNMERIQLDNSPHFLFI